MPAVRLGRAMVLFAVAPGATVCLVGALRAQPGSAGLGGYTAIMSACAALCGLRAVRRRDDRLPWALIGAGLFCYTTATLVYAGVLVPRHVTGRPSVSDGLWLLFYPLVIIAIGLMVKRRVAGSATGVWLDGVVSGLGLASVSAALVLPPMTRRAAGPPAAVLTTFAYPLLDLALAATVVGATATLGAWRQRPWIVLSAGFALFSAADTSYQIQGAATHQAGTLLALTYLLGAGLVVTAARMSPGRADQAPRDVAPDPSATHRTQTRSFLVPGSFALIAIGVLALSMPTQEPLSAALAAGALLAAWARTWLAVREVVRLSDSRLQARTDALTGLPNRRAFYEILEAAGPRRSADEGHRPASVVLADLDGFKEINDALGHHLGDQLLQEVGRRFAAQVPEGGTIARLGGDEMALFLPGMPTAAAGALSEQLLGTLDEPFLLQDMSLHVGASIGITAVEAGDGVSRALAKADLAMYRAKASRAGWAVYDDDRDGDAWDRLATLEALRAAFTVGGLTIELQPISDAASSRPVGMEALVRWYHPVRGRIAPDAFLPLAEKAGLMPAITRIVLGESLDAAKTLRGLGWAIPVSVNLSASDLLDKNLVDQVAAALGARGLDASCLHLEITESLFVDSGSGAADQLVRLRALGIELAVDDYGTGYSCLAYLQNLPVDYLKIDRGFTARVLQDDRTALIVASTVGMARGLGLRVVAEGVETPGQREWLHDHRCDLVQGFLLGRPMPPATLYQWLAGQAPAELPTMS